VSQPLAALAPAKINLTLRIVGRRADGFHDLESLVVFAPFGDRVTLRVGAPLSLSVSGPTAGGAGPLADNLVLRAAHALADRIAGLALGHFSLVKRLPSGAGLGGGSADAAAALRLIAQANALPLDDPRVADAARSTGADVPVCLDPRPRVMTGIGDILSAPVPSPRLGIVLVHPGVAVPTGEVFKALKLAPGERRHSRLENTEAAGCAGNGATMIPVSREPFLAWLAGKPNDLEPAAIAHAPVIAMVLAAIAELTGCRLARMSGSGSACFGLFNSARGAATAGRTLAAAHPEWWVRAGRIGG
jgi:4-diphosphocytidyl-2-C-methyl-D-erythritol kinase